MIITCTSCKKKFEIDENLIPESGRLLKCGSCNHTWLFNKNDQKNTKSLKLDNLSKDVTEETSFEINKYQDKNVNENTTKIQKTKGSELVKYKGKSSFKITKILNYLIVLIITFIAIIVFLDTFKDPLSIIFPNLELVLYNLFETLRDLVLFVKDLS